MTEIYRGYEISQDSIVGGLLISKGGEFVDRVAGDYALARHTVDQIIEEDLPECMKPGWDPETPGREAAARADAAWDTF